MDFGEAEVNEKKDAPGPLALHLAACTAKSLPEVKRLLSLGADVHSQDTFNNTPLHYAATYSHDDLNIDIIKILIESGANVDAQNLNGTTPLHFLIPRSNAKTVNLLLNFGAKVNIKDNQGDTPLSIAMRNDYQKFELLKLLLDYGSDVNNSDENKNTPLHCACARGHFRLFKFLVENGANVNSLNSEGRTPLMMDLRNFDLSSDWVRFLIKYSDVNTDDLSGKNFLFYLNHVREESAWKTILEYVAKLQALDLPIHQELHETILNHLEYREYFKECTKELEIAKSTKLENCWVTFFNLLLDNKRKLKNYSGNEDLIECFKNSDYLNKFPIYGPYMLKKVDKGIETRKSFDESTVELSYCLPIFNPVHLIIKDVMDCLTLKDYNRLISEV